MVSQKHYEDTAPSREHNKIHVKLLIHGFSCHPNEVTQILGLVPTDTWIAGQPVPSPPGPKAPPKQNVWILKSPLDGSPEIEEQVDALINAIAPQAERFRDIPNNVCVELSCSVYGYECMPAIHFTTEQVRFLASLEAAIDVDVYDLTDCQTEGAEDS